MTKVGGVPTKGLSITTPQQRGDDKPSSPPPAQHELEQAKRTFTKALEGHTGVDAETAEVTKRTQKTKQTTTDDSKSGTTKIADQNQTSNHQSAADQSPVTPDDGVAHGIHAPQVNHAATSSDLKTRTRAVTKAESVPTQNQTQRARTQQASDGLPSLPQQPSPKPQQFVKDASEHFIDQANVDSNKAAATTPKIDQPQPQPIQISAEKSKKDSLKATVQNDTDRYQVETDKPPITPGDVVLRGLNHLQVPSTDEESTTPETSRLSELTQKIADKILVSMPQSGASEVRITLQDSVLNGAEVQIRRENGAITIALIANGEDSKALLNQHKNDLQQNVESRLHDPVNVVIRLSDNAQANASGNQQQGQGRSRQQRDLYDEWNQQN